MNSSPFSNLAVHIKPTSQRAFSLPEDNSINDK